MTDSDRDTQLLEAGAESEHHAELPAAIAESNVEPASTEPLIAPPIPSPTGLSPDGTTLAYFMADADGEFRLWFHSLDNGEKRSVSMAITVIEDPDGPQWSPDGTTLAITAIADGDRHSSLWFVDVETGKTTRLFDRDFPAHTPRWSPNGVAIAFVVNRGGRESICLAPVDEPGQILQMTDGFAGQQDREPVWSKTGDRIAFCRRTIEGTDPQIVDHIWVVTLETGETKQLTKRAAIRHSLRWGPERPLIAHVSQDSEWNHIAVVNADNSAGWTMASEAGDKEDPRWSSDGSRLLYTRSQGGFIHCCDRATSSASAVLLDPGDGVTASPRWLPDGRVVYIYATVNQPYHFLIQENKADAERTEIAISDWQPGRRLTEPKPLELQTGAGVKLNGLFYRMAEAAGLAPGIIYLEDRPDEPQTARFLPTEQALAAAGYAVYAPILPGMRGLGRTIAKRLHEQADTEEEVADLADLAEKLRNSSGVDTEHVVAVGRGFGGTLALLLAGARPGSVQAVVAIDPISDWDTEFDYGDDTWRAWLAKTYGLPAAQQGRYALRTPATFVGVIDIPFLLLGTKHAAAHRASQLDQLIETLNQLGVPYERDIAPDTEWETGMRIAAFLRDVQQGTWQPDSPKSEVLKQVELPAEPTTSTAQSAEPVSSSSAVVDEADVKSDTEEPVTQAEPEVSEQNPVNENVKVPHSDALRTDSV